MLHDRRRQDDAEVTVEVQQAVMFNCDRSRSSHFILIIFPKKTKEHLICYRRQVKAGDGGAVFKCGTTTLPVRSHNTCTFQVLHDRKDKKPIWQTIDKNVHTDVQTRPRSQRDHRSECRTYVWPAADSSYYIRLGNVRIRKAVQIQEARVFYLYVFEHNISGYFYYSSIRVETYCVCCKT